jgi:hypothetical protein
VFSLTATHVNFVAGPLCLCILKTRTGILRARSETRFHVTLISG